jgi:phosphomethylpyrimidine synthase
MFKNKGRTIGIRCHNDLCPPLYCGEGCPTRVLASIGLSFDTDKMNVEIEKAKKAISAGAEIITDHSVYGDISSFQKELISNINVPVSYLTIYELLSRLEKAKKNKIEKNMALELIEEQAERGITLLTIHATANQQMIDNHRKIEDRTILSTSRGGAAILDILMKNNDENVYWEYFDDVCKIIKKHNITLSLGSTYRPASICDAGEHDLLYWEETKLMGQLVDICINQEIPVMVEGIGHAPIHEIPNIIRKSKEICKNVPYRVLSVATDIALGLDHISSAIAISVAAASGADLATCITRAEHLGQPFQEDIVEGVLAARVAAHCGDISKLKNFEKDKAMSSARANNGCHGILSAAINKEMGEDSLVRYSKGKKDGEITCSMCGNRCALAHKLNKVIVNQNNEAKITSEKTYS